MFKIGELVICTSTPRSRFTVSVGGIYKISNISECGNYVSIHKDYIFPTFFADRFKKIDDNNINRLLYPEAFNGV